MIEIVAAIATGGVIGYQGDIPWRGQVPGDMRHFQELTTGHIVVMGRKTWESLPTKYRPLPGRTNIVITRGLVEGADITSDGSWLSRAHPDRERIFVIGGVEIYRLALPLAQRLHITEIDAIFPGDVFFPEINLDQWVVEGRLEPAESSKPRLTYRFVTYVRKDQGETRP